MAGLSIATGSAANVGSDALSGLWNKLVKVGKLIRGLPTAVRDMNVQVQRLKNVRDEINEVLVREQWNARRIVQDWLDKAGKAIESSESINNDYEQHKSCLVCCPNCLSRYRISKDITAWNLTVVQLHSEKASDFPFTGEYGDPTPSIQIPIQHPEFVGSGIENAQSKLESWLTEDTNIRVIGVCGMGGVGKTSLLQTINNSQKVGQSFAPITWLTFSREYDILNLQDGMASKLGLTGFSEKFPKSNFEGRKHKLFTCLRNKKFLLILDDMWRSEDLESLGVPLNDTAYKIVLSTRSQVVCKQMKVDQMLRVKPLSEEEGWQLFCKTAFQNGNVPQELEVVAKKIAGECKGLPLAIKVVAAGMANYSYENEIWEHALRQMQNLDEAFYVIHDEIEKELFQCLKWSYNALPEDLKTCFLYFAAYPEDSDIYCEEVIDFWIAEGLVKGNPESYLPDTALTFINFLRDRCLIEEVEVDIVVRNRFVKMHDILRDLAIRIAETEHRSYFKAGLGLSHFLEEVDVKGCARLSLMDNRVNSLPTAFACSSLSVLLLRGNRGIEEVSGSFLGELSALKILNLSQTGITSLPPSIGNLKHLASLQLEDTKICELPETIGDLNNLQFLNVSWCLKLRCLPERITELKRLRVLDIRGCTNLSHLPRGISKLVSLERLQMLGSNISMDFEEEANVEREYACLKDLQSLCHLRHLWVKMKSPIKEGVTGSWSKMRDLNLSFHEDVNQEYLPQDMQAMKDLEYFCLSGSNVERLPSWVSELQRLRFLILGQCKQLRELELGMGFPKLLGLHLYGLKSLECVSIVAAASGSGGLGEGVSALPMLNSLSIYVCEKLKTLAGRWDKLECLEHIVIGRGCWDEMQWEDPNMKSSLQGKLGARLTLLVPAEGGWDDREQDAYYFHQWEGSHFSFNYLWWS